MKKRYWLLMALALLVTTLLVSYQTDRDQHNQILISNSQLAQTAVGPVEYRLLGESGPWLLAIHGTPGGYDQIRERQGFRIIAPSRPGYLRTPLSSGDTPAKQAAAYAALLDTLQIERVLVIGESGGGPSAIAFAGNYPQRTQRLILKYPVSQSASKEQREMTPPIYLTNDFVNWLLFSLMDRVLGKEGIVKTLVPDPDMQQRILDSPTQTDRFHRHFMETGPINTRMPGFQNDMEQFVELDLPVATVTAPVLILHGTADTSVPFSQSEQLARDLSHARLHAIAGADHWMDYSHAQEIEEAIAEFGGRSSK